MSFDKKLIAKLTTNFQRARKYDKERMEEISSLYHCNAIEEERKWVADEINSWYNRMVQIDPGLTQEQKYAIARKFLKFRFGSGYYSRLNRKKHRLSPPSKSSSALDSIERLKEHNESPIWKLDKTIQPFEDEASIAAEEYLMELIKKEKTSADGRTFSYTQ